MIYVPEMNKVHTTRSKQKIYVGSAPDDYSLIPVSVVINCCHLMSDNSDQTEVLHIPFKDSFLREDAPSKHQVMRWLRTIKAFTDERDVLIHCQAGMNRSALIAALYLWEFHKRDFSNKDDLLKQMRLARSPILLNPIFTRMIERW